MGITLTTKLYAIELSLVSFFFFFFFFFKDLSFSLEPKKKKKKKSQKTALTSLIKGLRIKISSTVSFDGRELKLVPKCS